jgi:hypothetical protein
VVFSIACRFLVGNEQSRGASHVHDGSGQVSDNGGSLFASLTLDGFEDANGNPIAARWSRRGQVRWELSSRWFHCRTQEDFFGFHRLRASKRRFGAAQAV